MTVPESTLKSMRRERILWLALLAATALNCIFQIAWFWRFRARNITMDGIDYIGLARHLVDGNFRASLHGYWSPLTTWIIAALSVFSGNFTLTGRVETILSFLACLPLLYWLTWELWRSRVAAALAVFWFSTARGIVAGAVGSILADFVLTACVLLYFALLMRALRRNRSLAWVCVGAAHALAFLAKAIAMPWLAIATAIALISQNVRWPRRLVTCLVLAFIVPVTVWFAWGMTLRMKYGVFTTGYQLRQNLMINWHRTLTHHPRGDNLAYEDTSAEYDDYMVGELPWSQIAGFDLRNPGLERMIVTSEVQNAPQAAKEIVILLTPGGVVALFAMLVLLVRNLRLHAEEAIATGAALVSMLGALAAYCMLVFDGRYVIPVVAVLIAIASPILLPPTLAGSAPSPSPWIWKSALSLFAVSTIFFAVYWASPFRTVDRDFEASCYQAAALLQHEEPRGTLVSIGDAPYPEHGIGFEAGPYVAYLAGWRLVGKNAQLPDLAATDALATKALGTPSDAVMVWGSPLTPAYPRIVQTIQHALGASTSHPISDPYKGEIGTLILRHAGN